MEHHGYHEKVKKSTFTDRNSFDELSEFVGLAELYNASQDGPDIVLDYLQKSGGCQGISDLVKNLSETDAKDAATLLNSLYHLLLRIATDLTAYSSVGIAIANEILTHGMKTILNFVQAKQKPSRIKSSLHLLTAMVMLGSQMAHSVFVKLNISSQHFTHLFGRSNPVEEEDVRSSFLRLIMTFLIVGDNNVIRQLVESKGFLNIMFPGLLYDRAPVICHVLSTLQSNIIENLSIRKTTKIRLFNDFSLKYVLKLFLWSGPKRLKTSLKRKLGEDEEMPSIVTEQKYIDLVKNAAANFMLALCCSHKNGIIFRDPSLGTSGRNYNHVVTNILKSFPSPYSNSHMSKLITSILKICPDQAIFYLPSLKDNLIPRFSTSWFQAIDFLKKVVSSWDPVQCLFLHELKRPTNKLVAVAKAICIPDVITGFQIIHSFKDEHYCVSYHLLDYFSCILKQVKKIANCCKSPGGSYMYTAMELTLFYQSFITSFMNEFPLSSYIREFWDVGINNAMMNEQGVKNSVNVVGLEIPSLSAFLTKILEIISMLGDVYPDAILDINFPELLLKVKNNICHFTSDELCHLQLKIIELLASHGKTDSLFLIEGSEVSPLGIILNVYLSSEERKVHKSISNLIYKVFTKTNFFCYCEWEMNIWLLALKQVETSYQSYVSKFFEEILWLVYDDQNKFLDEILECITENSSIAYGCLQFSSGMHNSSIDPLQKFSEDQNMCHRQCFSPLVPASVYSLSTLSGGGKKACKMYLEIVFRNIMHYQYDVKAFFLWIKKHEDLFNPALIDYWKLLYSSKTKNKIRKTELFLKNTDLEKLTYSQKLQNLFVHSFSSNSLSSENMLHKELRLLVDQISDVHAVEIFDILFQLLMYIEIEINLTMKSQERSIVLHYINILNILLSKVTMEIDTSSLQPDITFENNSLTSYDQHSNFSAIKDILLHPIIVSWFLKTDELPSSSNLDVLRECSKVITGVANHMASHMTKNLNHLIAQNYLFPFKTKVIDFCSSYVVPLLSDHKKIHLNVFGVHETIQVFCKFFSSDDILTLLERFLTVDMDCYVNWDPKLLILSILLETYLNLEDYVLLLPKSIELLFKFYIFVKKEKRKKCLRQYLLLLLEKHPVFVYSIPEEIYSTLIEFNNIEDFAVINIMLVNNSRFCKNILQVMSTDAQNLHNCNPLFFINVISKCITANNCLNYKWDDCLMREIATLFSKSLWKVLKPGFDVKLNKDFKLNTRNCIKVFVEENYLCLKEIEKKVKKIEKKLDLVLFSSEKLEIILQIIQYVEKKNCSLQATSVSFIMKCLIETLSSSENENDAKLMDLITLCSSILKFGNISIDTVREQVGHETTWTRFLQKILKSALKSTDFGPDLLEVLINFYKILHNSNSSSLVSVNYVYDLLTGHSNFFHILLDENKLYSTLKNSILDFLILLIQMNKGVCKDSHVVLFLSAYNATLGSSDQRLLYLIKLYEECGINMSNFSPFLWGKAAIAHYSVKKDIKLFLWKQPKLEEVLGIFHADRLIATAINFPLSLKLEPSSQDLEREIIKAIENDQDQLYDPRFMLPLLASLLSPGSFVHCNHFIESKVLVVIFASLSSYDSNMRAIGYYCLSEFYSHLESSTYRERYVWINLLDSVKYSIETPNVRLPSIITIFLVKALGILIKPGSPMYVPLYKFLMIKPTLDLGHVPEFYKLFGSIDIEHRLQRNWILSLVKDGLRSSLDFHLCQKRYIFTILLPYFTSSVCVSEEKEKILGILSAAVSIFSSARILCQSGLILWLHNVIKYGSHDDVPIVNGIINVVRNLWSTALKAYKESELSCDVLNSGTDDLCGNESMHHSLMNQKQKENPNFSDDKENLNPHTVCKWIYLSFPTELLLVQFSLLKKISVTDKKTLFHYLQTLHDMIEHIQLGSMSSSDLMDSRSVPMSSLPFSVVLDVYNKWKSLDECNELNAKNSCMGIDGISTTTDFGKDTPFLNNELYTEKCHELFSSIILLWKPWFRNTDDELKYAFTSTHFLCFTHQLLKVSKFNPSISIKLSNWLLFCLSQDEKYVLVKLFLSTEGKARLCLQSILEEFEKSLKYENIAFTSTNSDSQSFLFSNIQNTNISNWRKVMQILLAGITNSCDTQMNIHQLAILNSILCI